MLSKAKLAFYHWRYAPSQQLGRNKKRLFQAGVFVASFLLLAQFLLPTAYVASAGTPQFNNDPGDPKDWAQAANVTQGGSWVDPLNGVKPGEQILIKVYYHNSVPETTATNTIIGLNFSNQASDWFNMTGSIRSDQTAQINNSVTVSINGAPQKLIVDSLAKWYPNHQAATYQWMPVTQTVMGATVAAEVNIGAIKGCFEYQGYVVFRATVSNLTANLTLAKTVRNVSQGQTSFSETVNANVEDVVEFAAKITASGTGTANSVMIADILPTGLEFLKGSVKVNGSSVGSAGDVIVTTTGYGLGTLNTGDVKTVTLQAKVKDVGTYKAGDNPLTNKAETWAANVVKISDTAQVIVKYSECKLTAPGPDPTISW